jgi:hypothetical protein
VSESDSTQPAPGASVQISHEDVIGSLLDQIADLSGQLAMARATIKALRRPEQSPAPASES